MEKGWNVHGTMRRSSNPNTQRISHLIKQIHTHLCDLSDASSVNKVIAEVKPDVIFNLAAQSDVRAAYDIPLYTGDVTGLGFTRILEAARQHCPHAKIYQAGSSEMFGKVQTIPQNEKTPFYPRSPYGCAKVYAFYLGRVYRESYGMQIYTVFCSTMSHHAVESCL
jgi:GDPmannose 4,6-dehydratase